MTIIIIIEFKADNKDPDYLKANIHADTYNGKCNNNFIQFPSFDQETQEKLFIFFCFYEINLQGNPSIQ